MKQFAATMELRMYSQDTSTLYLLTNQLPDVSAPVPALARSGPKETVVWGCLDADWDARPGTPDLAQKRKPISLIVINLRGDHRHFVLRADLVGALCRSQLASSVDEARKLRWRQVQSQSCDYGAPKWHQISQRRQRGCHPDQAGQKSKCNYHYTPFTSNCEHFDAVRAVSLNGG